MANFCYHLEYLVGGNAAGKGSQTCSLDNRAFSGGVRKGDSKFDKVSAVSSSLTDKFLSGFKVGIAAGYERDKSLAVFEC